jgi:hypothetical protein
VDFGAVDVRVCVGGCFLDRPEYAAVEIGLDIEQGGDGVAVAG